MFANLPLFHPLPKKMPRAKSDHLDPTGTLYP